MVRADDPAPLPLLRVCPANFANSVNPWGHRHRHRHTHTSACTYLLALTHTHARARPRPTAVGRRSHAALHVAIAYHGVRIMGRCSLNGCEWFGERKTLRDGRLLFTCEFRRLANCTQSRLSCRCSTLMDYPLSAALPPSLSAQPARPWINPPLPIRCGNLLHRFFFAWIEIPAGSEWEREGVTSW